MTRWILLGFITLFCCYVARATSAPAEGSPSLNEPVIQGDKAVFAKNCRKLALIVGKQQYKAFSNCTKELHAMYPNKVEYTRHFSCAVRCTLLKSNVLDDHMKLNNASIHYYLETHVPAEYYHIGHTVMGGCLEEWGPKMNEEDEFCTAFGSFGACVAHFVSVVCSDKIG